jgi:uncharacterized protein (TIGR02145 family)
MKKNNSLQIIIFSCIIIIGVESCKKDKILLPTLTTTSVSNITETTAQSGGNVTNDGNDIVGSRGIVWSKSQQPTLEASNGYGIGGTGLGIFTIEMTGLEGNTTYYVRAFASNKAGTVYGNQQEFKSLLIEKASLLTEAAKDITTTSAIVGGNIQTDGGSVVSERGIYWSTSQNPEISGTKVQVGNGTGAFSFLLTNLSISTIYYVKAYAINGKGEALGSQTTFTTLSLFPSITTKGPSVIASFFSIIGGDVTSDGGSLINERGIFWGTNQAPELTGIKVISGNGIGIFSVQLTSLSANTTYYIKAYAKNMRGTSYGDQVTFTTNSTVADNENNLYGIVKIGSNWWLTENLKTKHYNNGEEILTTVPAVKDISNETTPKYQWAYDSTEANVAIFGRLYTAYVIVDSRGICPTGWHVATDSEWTSLTALLGGESIAGGKLKKVGIEFWDSPNTGASNDVGFSALPSGLRSHHGYFANKGVAAHWFTSTEYTTFFMWGRETYKNNLNISRSNPNSNNGHSIRCVKN